MPLTFHSGSLLTLSLNNTCRLLPGTHALGGIVGVTGKAVLLGVGVLLGVFVAVLVGVLLGVNVGVFVAVLVGVLLGVFVAVLVGVFVGVFVAVLVAVLVAVGVAVAGGATQHCENSEVSLVLTFVAKIVIFGAGLGNSLVNAPFPAASVVKKSLSKNCWPSP